MRIKPVLINFICMFILNKQKRNLLRTKLKFDTKWCRDFVYDYMGTKNLKLKSYVGHGCKNVIIVVDKKTCFKFPIDKKANYNPEKEKLIIDYFSTIVKFKLPKIEIIKHNGMYIKKYDFIDGVSIDDANRKLVKANISKIAAQITDFLFTLSTANPSVLKKFIPAHSKKPGFLYGWGHNDIGGNFILNPKTMDIIGFIDWESAAYGDLMPDIIIATRHWDRRGYDSLGVEIMQQYAKKYLQYVISKK